MLRSDASAAEEPSIKSNNSKVFDIEMINIIQKDIDPYDMISLVFLLYEIPETALERLTVYQRVLKDIEGNNMNLLHDWVLHVHHKPTWRDEFIEALYTCQLYSVLRKMGLDVSMLKRNYQESNGSHTLINPMKKILYKLCENMTNKNLCKLKNTLITYDIDVTDLETCELILLHLMCRKFFTLKEWNKQNHKSEPGIENIVKIIENFPEFTIIANELRRVEEVISDKTKLNSPTTSLPSIPAECNLENEHDKNYQDFNELFKFFDELKITENEPGANLKSDKTFQSRGMYPIKDPKKVGVCLIINQEEFYPSKDSIKDNVKAKSLSNRKGSTIDKNTLTRTMNLMNFEVITRDNLDFRTMLETIRNIIEYRVSKNHSMFMLCILSHGTRGHVYAADSLKVKVEDIENMMDSDYAVHLQGMPKLLILQACQVEDDDTYTSIVADSPIPRSEHYIKKSDIIVFWATSPSYESYRLEKYGTIFIQKLCRLIEKYAHKEHISDIFTVVNNEVTKLCIKLKKDQLPKVESTLTKKLYLHLPEQ